MENKEKRRGHTHFKTITEVCIHVLVGAWEYIRAHDCEGMNSRTSLWGAFFFPVTSNFSRSSQSFSQLACNRGTTSPRKLFLDWSWEGCWESLGGRRLQVEAKPPPLPPPPPPATKQVRGDACEKREPAGKFSFWLRERRGLRRLRAAAFKNNTDEEGTV